MTIRADEDRCLYTHRNGERCTNKRWPNGGCHKHLHGLRPRLGRPPKDKLPTEYANKPYGKGSEAPKRKPKPKPKKYAEAEQIHLPPVVTDAPPVVWNALMKHRSLGVVDAFDAAIEDVYGEAI